MQVIGVGDIARIDAALAVVHNDVDGYLVETIELAFLQQEVELVNLTSRLADAPAKKGVELDACALAGLYQTADVQCFHHGDHWHGR